MSDSKDPAHKEVKVEDLLRLKRAERPDDRFWDTFDRELHQRMLQTLVKKDPWYLQLMRGVTGRMAQTAAVGAAAAYLAMMVVRPALVETALPSGGELAQNQDIPAATAPIEVAMSDLDEGMVADYQIEAISTESSDLAYTPDYSLDGFEVASYSSDAYSADAAAFAVSGVATGLVY